MENWRFAAMCALAVGVFWALLALASCASADSFGFFDPNTDQLIRPEPTPGYSFGIGSYSTRDDVILLNLSMYAANIDPVDLITVTFEPGIEATLPGLTRPWRARVVNGVLFMDQFEGGPRQHGTVPLFLTGEPEHATFASGENVVRVRVDPPVPEPESWVMLTIGGVLVLLAIWGHHVE
jgi:hypothetical protein